MRDECLASVAVAGDDVEHAGRQTGITRNPRKAQRGKRRELGGLEHHRAARGERRRNFPCQHQQRKVPRNDLAANAGPGVARELAVQQLRPAGVVIEVPCDEWNIEITCFANRLAVVHRLEHGQQARMLLHGARKRIEMPRAAMTTECLPLWKRSACGRHGGIDIGFGTLRDFRQQGTSRRILHGKGVAMLRELAADEMSEGAELMPFDPFTYRRVAFRGGAVGHGLKDVGDGSHVRCERWVTASDDDTRQRNVRSRSVPADVRCR